MNQATPRSNDFTPVALMYDATRTIPIPVLEKVCRRLLAHRVLAPGAAMLDLGCGTGQITSVFYRAGFAVAGLGISAAMLAIARARMPVVPLHVGSANDLPFAAATFDAVIVSKLFQHLRDWPTALQEIARVLRPGGTFVHIRDRGAFRNAVRQRVEQEADARGYTDRYLGLSDHGTLLRELESLGAVACDVPTDRLTWGKIITYGEALAQLQQRLFAELWVIPEDDYERIMADVGRWVDAQPDGARTRQVLHARVELDAFRFATVV